MKIKTYFKNFFQSKKSLSNYLDPSKTIVLKREGKLEKKEDKKKVQEEEERENKILDLPFKFGGI